MCRVRAIIAAMTDATGPELLGICVVANVAQETSHGEGGLEIRKGLRHFAPGAKVWIAPPAWGDGGERVIVAGRHRGNSRRYMRIVIESRFLVNFRVRAVYSPALARALAQLEAGEEKEFGARWLWPSNRRRAGRGPGTRRRWGPGWTATAVGSAWSPILRPWNCSSTASPTTWPTSTPVGPATRPSRHRWSRR